MTDLEALLSAKAAAEQALAEHEKSLLAELVAAKDAARDDATPANRARKREAVEAINRYRNAVRSAREAERAGGASVEISPPPITTKAKG